MSKYRYWWWPNVCRALRTYPYLKRLQNEAPETAITPSYTGMPRGGGNSRPTERAAMKRKLSQREEDFVHAVDQALAEVAKWPDAREVTRLIQLVDFQRRFTVNGAAMYLHMSERTARRRRQRFVEMVGIFYGF